MNYSDFADWIFKTGILSDPYIDGEPRFDLNPTVIEGELLNKFKVISEQIGELYDEFSEIVLEHPEFLDEYFNLTFFQKKMWLESSGLWHGISRLDLFQLNDNSIQMCEMNSDTPSGEGEAILLNEYCSKFYPEYFNPNSEFKKQFLNLIQSYIINKNIQNTVAIVYPTEFTEDLSMIKIYENWIKELGLNVVKCSPFNIKLKKNQIFCFNNKIDILLRHYKTDWWGERFSSWIDEFVPDENPIQKQLSALFYAENENQISIINPFGAVLTQNKLSLSFFYDKFEYFSKKSQNVILKVIPETRRAQDVDFIYIDKDEWVLKSIYGCEGDEVLIGKFTKSEDWDLVLSKIDNNKWVLQKYFESKKINDTIPNYGVYLIKGKFAGIFIRNSNIQTEYNSLTVPTLVKF